MTCMAGSSPNPGYYADHAVSPIDLMDSYGMAVDFARGSAIKYLSRAPEKDGAGDYLKAVWYTMYVACRVHGMDHEASVRIARQAAKVPIPDNSAEASPYGLCRICFAYLTASGVCSHNNEHSQLGLCSCAPEVQVCLSPHCPRGLKS